MIRRPTFGLSLVAAAAIAAAMSAPLVSMTAQEQNPGYTDTPMLPGQKWRVHDANRPRPQVVKPQPSKTLGMKPPEGATVICDGKGTDNLNTEWKVENGYLEVAKGGCSTKEALGDMFLHLEFATPKEVKGHSQERGNSGVIIMGRYEIQVLDSHENPTYADGQCAAIYGQFPPKVNASLPPGEWQTYDICFQAPQWKGQELSSPAVSTVLHNGVLVHDKQVHIGRGQHRKVGTYEGGAHAEKLPLELQNHGNPMRFRNIWWRPLKDDEKLDAKEAMRRLNEHLQGGK